MMFLRQVIKNPCCVLRALHEVAMEGEPTIDASGKAELDRFWKLMAAAIEKGMLIPGRDFAYSKEGDRQIALRWSSAYVVYNTEHAPAYGRTGNSNSYMLGLVMHSPAFEGKHPSYRLSKDVRTSVLLFNTAELPL
jgi:hypothetical protein